jgi:hypothetical protein
MRTRKNLKQTQELFLSTYLSHLSSLVSQGLLPDPSPYLCDPSTPLTTLRSRSSLLAKSFPPFPDSLRTLRDDLSCIFEWHDGILVEAM